MDKIYILLIKGFIVGIGKIIPGVSGSLFAIIMGIYDKSLNYISSFFKNPKQSIRFLTPIGMGLLTAIIFFSNIIFYFINNCYFPIMFLFLGLILGGLPMLIIEFKNSKLYKKDKIFITLLLLLIPIIYLIYTEFYYLTKTISSNFIKWFILGGIEATTMIIPGISGTAILMMLGCYDKIILMYANPLSNINLIAPFILGLFLTLIILTKIISWLLNNCSKSMYLLIIILVIISIISLSLNTFANYTNIIDLIIGSILLIIGCVLSYFLDNIHKKY